MIKELSAARKKLDWAAVKKGPKAWAKRATLDELIQAVTEAKLAYYNTGESLITDATFDLLEAQMLAQGGSASVGATPTAGRKVRLSYFMGSQDKVKDPAALQRWFLTYGGSSYLVSDKLDGVSYSYENNLGKIQLFTRGDGLMGQDISFLIPYIPSLPRKLPKGHRVRGELIMPSKSFDKSWANAFKNPRNLVSGIANSQKVHPAVKDLVAVAYELVEPKAKPSAQLAKLKDLGFMVVAHKLVHAPVMDFEWLTKWLTKRIGQSPYAIDGLVVVHDQAHTRVKQGNPPHSFAFKLSLQDEESAIVEVVRVEWQPSRYGTLKPVIIVRPLSAEAKRRLPTK